MAEMEEAEHAMEIAVDTNLNYIEISKCMCNVLQDVEDIMANQLTNVFQLSKWVANIADIFSLKICNEEEWEAFNNQYNQVTGEVTNYKPPYESINATNNTHMKEVDRDELSKACVELDTACTTIKNLSEAVVNFSHT